MRASLSAGYSHFEADESLRSQLSHLSQVLTTIADIYAQSRYGGYGRQLRRIAGPWSEKLRFMEGPEMIIQLKADAIPHYVNGTRPIAFADHTEMKLTLDGMEAVGIV
ncbi:hypothetical protein DAPPUDRAFT_247120 [Daphnia pulex]|uniref:Uncharacterized protein n=1 Tax=Daphnia pulex TaxID=6669 RepID=E9GRS7_DAPPU|nr:hypothetical protein DAPPUDRAFT_247120 [Daphnia pulex]|eukprot:EFX77826.1 hypothetical protein DAPPUDRAFT_247120 [Daphnia pulex]